MSKRKDPPVASSPEGAPSVLDVFNSRRSEVYSTKGICASSQPLATAAGVKILEQGGNAADACVAMAAALNVTEPCSTGIGGDAFALYFSATSKKVTCLQGNGASPASISLDMLAAMGIGSGPGLRPLDRFSGLCATVPGAPMLWEDTLRLFGSLDMSTVLQPAIGLAQDGFPLSPMTAEQWAKGHTQGEEAQRVLRPNGINPIAGQIVYNPDLAKTFRILATKGAKDGFYKGEIAEAIVEALLEYGGVLSLDDLSSHATAMEEPICISYKGYRIYETPPPTQGLAALIALSLLDKAAPDTQEHNRGSEMQAHYGVEAMRLAFADALQYISDPRHRETPVHTLLSDEYMSERASAMSDRAGEAAAGDIAEFRNGDTVLFCCIDKFGNGCSMINSNYQHFGTGIMPRGTGFTIQNRGFNFSLQRGHPNELAPRKRPYHTIIPCMITREDGSLFSALGNMGGFMQPQGHVQLIRNLLDFKMAPQAALNAPRWMLDGLGKTQSASDVHSSRIIIEEGYGGASDGGARNDDGEDIARKLRARGHHVEPIVRGTHREIFGRGQIIIRDHITGVLCAGSDPRADGCAAPAL